PPPAPGDRFPSRTPSRAARTTPCLPPITYRVERRPPFRSGAPARGSKGDRDPEALRGRWRHRVALATKIVRAGCGALLPAAPLRGEQPFVDCLRLAQREPSGVPSRPARSPTRASDAVLPPRRKRA